MTFDEYLNLIIEEIGCTSKEISFESKISEAVISRYRNGDRIPKYNSDKYKNLINAIIVLSKKYNINSLNYKDIDSNFSEILNKNNIDFDIFRNNLNILINELNINANDLSKNIGFDSSYISKIKKGYRKPQNINEFAKSICKYIFNNYDNNNLSLITNTSINNYDELYNWIVNYVQEDIPPINSFLEKLDSFDLNEYIKVIKFDKIKIPTSPITLPKEKKYYGLSGFKKSQLDVLKTIVLSKNKGDVFFYSNMPLIEASKDLDFTKKFMVGLAFLLKKGLHLNMVHNLDRPFKEIMLGLEGWIPLYMTGQISPYYFKKSNNDIYSHIHCISNSCILDGLCINNNIKSSTFYLSNKKEDINNYLKYSDSLLKIATPLMDIYNENKEKEFNKFLDDNINIKTDRRNILFNLPNYVLDNNFLNYILDKNSINKKDKEKIINLINKDKNRIKKILVENNIEDEINIIKEEDFNNYYLDLSRYYLDTKVKYDYNDYKKHIELIKKFKKENNNYSYIFNNNHIFKNINITILLDKQVIISKENSPCIHFVIYNKKLIDAISNFKAPIIEKDYTN